VPISLPVDNEANELLSRNPLALLIAMLLDQHMQKNWQSGNRHVQYIRTNRAIFAGQNVFSHYL
jgi:hypothetical protein